MSNSVSNQEKHNDVSPPTNAGVCKGCPSFSVDVLEAGLSAIMGKQVLFVDTKPNIEELEGEFVPTLTMNTLLSQIYATCIMACNEAAGLVFPICVKTLTNSSIYLQVASCFAILNVKASIQQKEGIPAHKQMLYFNGMKLPDDETVGRVGILSGSTIFLRVNLQGSGPPLIRIPREYLAPEHNFDYTHLLEDRSTYTRGDFTYQRPYGWYKYGLKADFYSRGNNWLGSPGIRTYSTSGEWPVAYHGPTNKDNVVNILCCGYKIGSGDLHGRGVYSSPSVETAAKYAATFSHEGRKYQLVLQNRVNPRRGHLIIVPRAKTPAGYDEYWISPEQDPDNGVFDVRPYGVLVRQIF